jgi:hypothetical protein
MAGKEWHVSHFARLVADKQEKFCRACSWLKALDSLFLDLLFEFGVARLDWCGPLRSDRTPKSERLLDTTVWLNRAILLPQEQHLVLNVGHECSNSSYSTGYEKSLPEVKHLWNIGHQCVIIFT